MTGVIHDTALLAFKRICALTPSDLITIQAVPIKQEDGSDTAAAAPELPPLGGADAAGSASQQQQPHQGLAWAALGKLCMVDETLAKKCLPLMVQVRVCETLRLQRGLFGCPVMQTPFGRGLVLSFFSRCPTQCLVQTLSLWITRTAERSLSVWFT